MSTSRNRWRKIARWALVALGLAVLFLATLPIWFPWVLKPVLGWVGLHYQDYQRHGYSGFGLTRVDGTWENTRVEAEQVEGVLPFAWVWRRAVGTTSSPPFSVKSWRVTVTISNAPPGAPIDQTPSTVSMTTTLDDLAVIGAALRTWLRAGVAKDGVVQVGSYSLVVTNAEFRHGQARALVQAPPMPEPIAVTAAFVGTSNAIWSLRQAQGGSLVSVGRDATLQGRLDRDTSGWKLNGQLEWETNRVALSAAFGPMGWWPTEGRIEGRDLHLPSGFWRSESYVEPLLSLAVQVVSNRFELEARGATHPLAQPETVTAPSINVHLQARGDPELITVFGLDVRAGCVSALLTNQVTFPTSGEIPTNSALFQLGLDLANAPGLSLTGRGDGIARVNLGPGPTPTATFELSGGKFRGYGLETEQVNFGGALNWPRLAVEKAEVRLQKGPVFSATAAADLAAEQIGFVHWRLVGERLTNELLRCASLTATGTVSGAFSNLTHAGEFNLVQLETGAAQPLNARGGWLGTNLQLPATTLELTTATSSLALAGAVSAAPDEPGIRARLSRARFERQGRLLYELSHPFTVRWQAGLEGPSATNWSLAVDSFEWKTPEHRLAVAADLAWPGRGSLTIAAQSVALADFAEFVPAALTNIVLNDLNSEAQWTNGPVRATVAVDATVSGLDDSGSVHVHGNLRSDAQVEIEQLVFRSKLAPPLVVKGSVPVAVHPGQSNGWLRADAQRPLDLRADLEAAETLSWPLGARGALKVTTPSLHVVASGTLDQPSAVIAIGPSAGEWHLGTNGGTMVRLEQVQLDAIIAPERIEVRHAKGTLDGEAFYAEGEWPLAPGFWTRLRERPKALDWSAAQGRLEIANAKVAVLSRYAPLWLAPEGQMQANLVLRPGRVLDGLIVVTNASTRPLGEISPLRDISARLQFTGEEATLTDFRGELGGQPVRATGLARFASAKEMEYQLRLQGSNVPLSRSVQFLLRGDLDVQLKGNLRTPPSLSGQVHLRDGLFVQHATAFMLSMPERPSLRPPYFTVTNVPFADWRLDLSVRGEQFLRVRTPVFAGSVSANVRLSGQLREPVMVGDAHVVAGRVMFPFGTLDLDQAFANLDAQSARGPELLVRASGRNYRYDIRLEIKGPADGANVLFTSTPPLTSEEILLMLTAGELPKSENVFSTTARAGQLATFLGRDLVSRITGSGSGRERLIINTSENLTEEGKTTHSVEYRLTDRWSLVGEYDRFSEINAAVKWRILSR